MQMKRCEMGHYYDPEKHSTCPFCGVSNLDIGETRPHIDASDTMNGFSGQKKESSSTHRPGQSQVRPNDEAHTWAFFVEKPESIQWWDGWYVSKDLTGGGIIGFIRNKTLSVVLKA